jgi:hypothetical protein
MSVIWSNEAMSRMPKLISRSPHKAFAARLPEKIVNARKNCPIAPWVVQQNHISRPAAQKY